MNRKAIVTFLAVLSSLGAAFADTTIRVSGRTLVPSVRRFGMNLGYNNYFDSGQLLKELVFRNPGFEGLLYRSLRRSGSAPVTFLQRTVTLTNSWNAYTFDFTAAESSAAPGMVSLQLAPVNLSAILLDDVSLARVDGDPTNPTAFRDPVVNALKAFNPTMSIAGPGLLSFGRPSIGVERFLYVWTGDQARANPDCLAVVDFDEASSGYGRVLTTVPIPGPGASGNEPHHVALSRNGRILACGGLLSVLRGQKEIFFVDVTNRSNPSTLFMTFPLFQSDMLSVCQHACPFGLQSPV